MSSKKIPARCPVCGAENVVTEVSCATCDTHIRGSFTLCKVCALPPDLYEFTLTFLMARGSIKEVEKLLGISYPTVRNRLDQVLQHLGVNTRHSYKAERIEILKKIENGELTAEEAVNLLKGEES